MLKTTNMPTPLKLSTKKTHNNGVAAAAASASTALSRNGKNNALAAAALDNDDSDTDDETDLDIEEEDDDIDLLDDADDVVLQIDSEDEAELEAQRIRLDDMKAAKIAAEAAAAVAATATAETTKSQVSNGKELSNGKKTTTTAQIQAESAKSIQVSAPAPAARKPRGRPPGSTNKRKSRKNSNSSINSNSTVASGSTFSQTGQICAQIHVDEKAHRYIYRCVRCSLHYGDDAAFVQHWRELHNEEQAQQPQTKRPRKSIKVKSPPASIIKLEPALELNGLNVLELKNCAQLLFHVDSFQQLCLECNEKFEQTKELHTHLSEQHGIFKLVVPKKEPAEQQPVRVLPAVTPPLPMVTIPRELGLNKAMAIELELPVPAPETPPPEQDAREPTEEPDAVVAATDALSIESTEKAVVIAATAETNSIGPAVETNTVMETASATLTVPAAKPMAAIETETATTTVPPLEPKLAVEVAVASTSDKDDLEMINAIVKEITAEDNQKEAPSSPKVDKMIIKLPVGKRASKARKRVKEQKQPQKPKVAEDCCSSEKPKRSIRATTKSPQPKEIKKEEQPITERRVRKARTFVDYVMDIKDEDDEDQEEERGASDSSKSASISADTSLLNSSSDSNANSSTQADFIKLEKSEATQRQSSHGEIQHTCNFCSKIFKRFSRLQDHLRLHTGEKPFVCLQCGRAFRLKMRLAEHQLRHRTEKAFKCEICSLPLATKQDLALHMRHHKNDRRYKCDSCHKAFVRSSDLAIHVRVHTGEKPYSCDLCGKAFRARQNLVVHHRIHLGEKPIQCELCEKRFSRKIDMRVHMRRHTGEKPFTCSSCQRAYSSRVNLQRHQEREHGKSNSPQSDVESNNKKARTRRPRRDKLEEKIAAQEKLLDKLKRSLNTLPDISEQEQTPNSDDIVENKVINIPEMAADAGAGCAQVAQVSVTVSMQVESVKLADDNMPAMLDDEEETTPEKENAMSSSPIVATTSAQNGKLNKTNRKITSYFTVVGQKAEI